MKNNIKLFDSYAGFIFNKVYSNFPKCVEINVTSDIQSARESDNTLKIECENISDEEQNIIFTETIFWLTRNGFINYKTSEPDNRRPIEPMPYRMFYCVELTINGLNLLSSPTPKTFKVNSVGDEVIDSVKKGMYSEAGKVVTRAMFEFALKKFTGEADERK